MHKEVSQRARALLAAALAALLSVASAAFEDWPPSPPSLQYVGGTQGALEMAMTMAVTTLQARSISAHSIYDICALNETHASEAWLRLRLPLGSVTSLKRAPACVLVHPGHRKPNCSSGGRYLAHGRVL